MARRLALRHARPVYLSHAQAEAAVRVEIEAKLTDQAFDEDSARKKVEKAFASGRVLGPDVKAGAGVWTYAVVSKENTPGS